MKKMKVLYDAHILRDGLVNQNYRRGIYWVAYNVLYKFLNDERFDVTLFLNTNTKKDVLQKDELLKNIKLINKDFVIGKAMGEKKFSNPKFHIENYDFYFNVDFREKLDYK